MRYGERLWTSQDQATPMRWTAVSPECLLGAKKDTVLVRFSSRGNPRVQERDSPGAVASRGKALRAISASERQSGPHPPESSPDHGQPPEKLRVAFLHCGSGRLHAASVRCAAPGLWEKSREELQSFGAHWPAEYRRTYSARAPCCWRAAVGQNSQEVCIVSPGPHST